MEQHEESDEGWIVSYADLVTLMLGFFILMYKVVADEGSVKKLEKAIGDAMLGNKRASMEQVLEEASEERKARAFQLLVTMLDLGDSAENAVGNIERKYAEAGSAEAFQKILDQEMSPKAKQQLQVLKAGPLQKDIALRIVIPSDTTFRSGEADINSLTRNNLAELARGLLPMDDLLEVEITGHTDEQPTRAGGKWASNWELSAARAAAVAAVMRSEGLSGEKLRIAGVAHFQPLVPVIGLAGESLLDARAQNRRIEIAIKRKRPVQKQETDAEGKVKP
ncbi:OmpA/MotB family protein [Oligoflexus tunisiensis]|uniref:OmpA/MotB family protein n=1 Tax=Oligoflexus tunisiensis TaxID=708132 RepID=UPI00159F0C6E|nr:OmpA family protein [Oligoflexus tunisiensis]